MTKRSIVERMASLRSQHGSHIMVLTPRFPYPDAGPFAGHIFATFDRDEDGHVTFDQFIQGMSTISRETLLQKARWVFNLYDNNGTGKVTKSNLRDIVSSVYQLLEGHAKFAPNDFASKEHVDRLFDVRTTEYDYLNKLSTVDSFHRNLISIVMEKLRLPNFYKFVKL